MGLADGTPVSEHGTVTTRPASTAAQRWVAGDIEHDLVVAIDLTDLERTALELAPSITEPTEVGPDDCPLGAAEPGVAALIDILDNGRGLAFVDGFPVDRLDLGAIQIMYWRLGLALGTPVSQSVMGDVLGHVVDTTDVDPHARAYRRNEELTPHSDPADYLGFLCIRPAARGGASWFASSLEIHERLRQERPDLLDRLYRGYRYSRFGEQSDDEFPITPYRVPVFSERDGAVSCRLVRQYIEIAADEDPACALDDQDRAALDLLDRLSTDPELGLRVTLHAGQAVFANNYTVLHAREAFHDPPGRPGRHLLRLWLDADPGRPVVPESRIYPLSAGIPPQPGRLPSYATTVELI